MILIAVAGFESRPASTSYTDRGGKCRKPRNCCVRLMINWLDTTWQRRVASLRMR